MGLAAAVPAGAQADQCPNAEFRTGASSHLPDCRAYEKVSPEYKGNGEVAGGGLVMIAGFRASASGDRILYPADSVFLGAPAFPQVNGYFADRGETAWANRSVTALLPYNVNPSVLPTGMVNTDVQPLGFSADGRRTVAMTNRDPVTGDAEAKQPYLVDLVAGSVERMAPDVVAGDPAVPLTSDGSGSGFSVAGDEDYSDVYYSTPAQLSPAAAAPGIPANLPKLYRFADGESTLASYLPDGTPTHGIAVDSAEPVVGRNSVSPDGGVYWFMPGVAPTTPGRNELYRGEAGVQASAFVSESESTGPPHPVAEAHFQGASADGQRALFTANQALVDGMPPIGGGAQQLFLYTHSANPASDANLTLVSVDSEPADGLGGTVSGVWGVSDDARTAYFSTSGAQLVAGESVGPGAKLYRWHDGELDYLATAAVTGDVNKTRAAVTADGRYLMFMSSTSGVTADDTAGTVQQYRYDAVADEIRCSSCRTGAPSTASAQLGPFLNFMQITTQSRRWLADDGRVFFETAERLVPADTNGVVDVYTWRDGQQALISSGRSTSSSRFGDASSDGSTVFFATRDRLSGWDTDDRADLYAARVGGGLREPAIRPDRPCVADDCQGPASRRPAAPREASADIAAAGNVAAARSAARRPLVAKVGSLRGVSTWMRVRVSGKGAIRILGPRVRRSSKRAARAGTYRVRVRLSPRARRALSRSGRVTVRVTVRFVPQGSDEPRSARKRLTFKAKGGR